MDGGLIIKQKPITLSLIIFTFLCFLFLGTKAQAFVYCVTDGMMGSGCSNPSAGTCTGGGAATCGAGICDTNPNGQVCDTIAEALACIDTRNDANAIIRVGTGTHDGPGTGAMKTINNTAGAAQDIDILGGFASNCVTRTINPSNTTVEAPMDDRVFHINNTMSNSLNVTLEGLTITGGDPMSDCDDSGGGVCVTSTAGTGGVIFTSSTNIYDDNMANQDGGGLAVKTEMGGNSDINATTMNDTFTNNSASSSGGAMLFRSDGQTLDATISGDIIGGDFPFPLGGNESASGGGIAMVGDFDGELNVTSQGNLIKSNSSGNEGGGVSILNASSQPANVSFEGDEITFNEATTFGGGIAIDTFTGDTVNVSISRTEIGNNSAGTFGGGIAFSGAGNINTFTIVDSVEKAIENNIIHNNIALGSLGGGGVAADTGSSNANYEIKFVNNTIADNQAPNSGGQGGGILADNASNGQIDWTLPNDIIFFNSSADPGDQVALVDDGPGCPGVPTDCATLVLRFTDISNAAGDIVGTGTGVGFVNLVNPNIFTDPQFVMHSDGDYHLLPGSPAVDAGASTAILTVAGVEADPPTVDFMGNPRGMNPSIGALEPVPSPTPTPTPTTTPTPSPTPTTPPSPTPTPTIPPPTPTPTPQNMLIFSNANNGKIVTIESEPGTTIQGGPLGKTLNGCQEVNDQSLTFPVGSYEYFITGLNPGDATTVVIHLPQGVNVDSYIKYGKTPDDFDDHCYEYLFDPQTGTGAEILPNGTIIVHHVDGERGDDDLTPNEVIVDPAAPVAFFEPPDRGNGCSLASTVNSGSAVLNLFIPLIPVIAVGIRYLGRRRNRK